MNHAYSFSRSSVEFQFCMGNKIANFCIQYITRPVAAIISLRFALYYIWFHLGAALHMNDSKVMDGLDWTFWGRGLNVKAERVWFWLSMVCTRVRRVFRDDYIFGHVCLISALWWPPLYFHSSGLGLGQGSASSGALFQFKSMKFVMGVPLVGLLDKSLLFVAIENLVNFKCFLLLTSMMWAW